MINVAMKIPLGYFAAMRNNDALGAKPTDRSDWSDAFEAVSRLAAAREATMDGIKTEDRRGAAVLDPTSRRGTTSGAVAGAPKQGIDPDQLARAIADNRKGVRGAATVGADARGRAARSNAHRNAKEIFVGVDSHRRHLDIGDIGGRRRDRRHPLCHGLKLDIEHVRFRKPVPTPDQDPGRQRFSIHANMRSR